MRVLLLLLVLAISTGCQKKSSPEFYRLESAHSILVARDGDDAYVEPEMADILAGLGAVPSSAIEKPRAVALEATIRQEQQRVARERTPPPKQPEVDPFAGRTIEPSPVVEPELPTPAVFDAGEEEPTAGISERAFLVRYGKCFAPGPATQLDDGRAATSQVLAPNAECQKRVGAPSDGVTSFLFTADGGLWGKSTRRIVTVDAGSVKAVAPPVVLDPDAGQPVPVLPGAPLPEGYQRAE